MSSITHKPPKMTISQLKAMIAFHGRAAAAYRAAGATRQARQAEALRAKLQAKLERRTV